MDEETVERIIEKTEYVRDCLEVLTEERPSDEKAYFGDSRTRDIVERRFETAIQACIDIASMILNAENKPVPKVYSDRMEALVDLGVLSSSTGEQMASAAGFRNVLAHRYGADIDNGIVYDNLHDLSRFQEYLIAVGEYLSAKGAL